MKNTCKKIIKLSAVLTLAGMPSAVMATPAPTVSLELGQYDTTEFTIPGYSSGYGGPFIATTSANGTFTTFCVQTTVDINTGTGNGYTYTLSQSDSSGFLSLGAAYLYSSYINGSLASLLTGSATVIGEEYGELQAAIWTLQNQPYDYPSALPGSATSNEFLTYAETGLKLSLTNLENDHSNGAYGVDIMNIVGPNGAPVQNQLIEVPDACSTALLLGAILPVGFVLRKKLGMVTARN